MRKSNGGGQIENIQQRRINAQDIALTSGYKIEPVVSGLSFPTAVVFDDEGTLYVIEAGYSYGEVWGEPKLLRVDANGKTTTIAKVHAMVPGQELPGIMVLSMLQKVEKWKVVKS